MGVASCNNMSTRLIATLFLSICLTVSNAYEGNEPETTSENLVRPEVTTLQGSVRGVTMRTKNNRKITGFLGIPFAEPPVGDLRFRAPVPARSWQGTLDAVSDTPDCPQLSNDNKVVGNEDCLYVNVYTPRLPKAQNSKLLPVMFYIYGGKALIGSNNSTLYGPGYLLDKDIVLVVPSYRLGPLGFLSTGDAVAPGNWALKDDELALKWTRDNIAFFGGDPDQVTISGNSAGSMAVNYLGLSDATNGLFQRYISQSGSGISDYAYHPPAVAYEFTLKLANHLDCPTNTTALMVECLRGIDYRQILDTASLYIHWGMYPVVSWLPTIEPDIEGAILTVDPRKLVQSRKLPNKPNIIGTAREEGFVLVGYLYAFPEKFEEFLANFDDLLPYVMNYQYRVRDIPAYTRALKSYYFNNDLTGDRTLLLAKLTQLCGDFLAKYTNYEEQQKSPAVDSSYVYSFEYRGTFSYTYVWGLGLTENLGVSHCDELIYLFPEVQALFASFNETMSETDLKMVDQVVELWTSFVIHGEPNTGTGRSWPVYPTHKKHLRIGNEADTSIEVESETSDFRHRMQFLEDLDAKYM